MKKIFILQFIIVFYSSIIAYASSPAGFPEEFSEIQAEDNEIIGYGEGASREEACTNAKKDIAKQIQTQIYSEDRFEKAVENNKLSEKGKTTVTEKTDAVLTDVDCKKAEPRGNTWYAAARYENLSIENKFVKRVSQLKQPCREERQNKYLGQTLLVKTINKDLGCKPDIRIARKNKRWYLAYGQIEIQMTDAEFERLFKNPYACDAITLKPSGEILTEGSVLSFSIAAKNEGYISLLNVYENGEVFVISSNQPIKANKKLAIPDPASDQELVCGLITPEKQASDLYVAVYSKNKLDLSRIQQVGKKVEKDEEHFKFDELLNILDENEFSSVLIRTKPKSE